jgi:ESF2/ABP1 family protein
MGGGRKVRYIEGWIEFMKKSEAKMCAIALNGTLMGGKKRHNLHRDDTWNMRYLSKFAWSNLTEKLAYDQKMRENRLKQVKSKTSKEISFFQEKQDLARKLGKIEERKVADIARHKDMESESEAEEAEPEEVVESGDEDDDDLAAIAKRAKN